ncbi:MAG TPA: TIR domain-containing protein [Thermomicrobiales bacterium]|nr:TIR domain-containing protein [Thermomicrobiales bacterium]
MHTTLDGDQPYVFISYASADREQVLPLAEALRDAGITCWLDQHDIAGGANWGGSIAGAIEHCAALVLMSSAASLASRNVRQEVALAWQHQKPCLPLLLDATPVPTDIAYWLATAQWIEVLDHPTAAWLPKVARALQPLIQREGTGARVPVAQPTLRPTAQANLPSPASSFVGREQEVAEVAALLHTERIVTLTGPGGIGKTRVAIAAGHRLSDSYADGVVFVDLAPLRDSTLVLPTIAAAVGVRESGQTLIADALATVLRPRRLLLILDNVEQVVEAAGDISRLVTACPVLAILTTSRELLRISGEAEYSIAPLQLPQQDSGMDIERLRANPTIALFVQRARSVKTGFDLTPENADAVIAICRRLDGLPLAIELAAARTRLLPPQALVDRLTDPLRFLTGGARDLPDRQRTMRDTVRWSYELLTPSEQRLLQRLSVFVGGWTLETGEAVVNADNDLGIDLLDGLASLMDKSLIVQSEQPEGAVRFAMLVMIREFGVEQLAASGDINAVERAHAATFLRLAKKANEHLLSADRAQWLEQLEVELGNLRVALAWSLRADPATNLELAGSLSWFWYLRGYFLEGRAALEMALANDAEQAPTAARATAMTGLARLAFYQEDFTTAQAYSGAAVSLWRALDQPNGLAHALIIAALAFGQIDVDRAVDSLHEAHHLFDVQGNEWGIGQTRLYLGVCGVLGWGSMTHPPAAIRAHLDASEAIYRRLGDRWQLGMVLSYLGMLEEQIGNLETALRLHDESHELARESGDKWRIRLTANRLGGLLHRMRAWDRAIEIYDESLCIATELGVAEFRAYEQEQLGRVLMDAGRANEALPLLEEALQTYQALGEQDHVALLRHAIGDARAAQDAND